MLRIILWYATLELETHDCIRRVQTLKATTLISFAGEKSTNLLICLHSNYTLGLIL